MGTCSIDQCEVQHYASGRCQRHYEQQRPPRDRSNRVRDRRKPEAEPKPRRKKPYVARQPRKQFHPREVTAERLKQVYSEFKIDALMKRFLSELLEDPNEAVLLVEHAVRTTKAFREHKEHDTAIALIRSQAGLSFNEIGKLFGEGTQTVTDACYRYAEVWAEHVA